MDKNILMINQYASTPETGIGGRHYYLAKELVKQGYRVYLVAAGYTHLLRNPPLLGKAFEIQNVDGIQFVWIKVPKYNGAHDKKRVLNWFLFAWKLLGLHRIIKNKPYAILASSPAPFLFLSAKRLAKKFGAKLIFEVRDIWPLTLIELGGYSSSNLFIRLMQWVEDKAYRESDIVISNLPNAVEHMASRGMKKSKFYWIPNGICLEEMKNIQPLQDNVLEQLPNDKFIIGYAGTVGLANALDVFLQAAGLLKDKKDIVFVIVGDGQEKERLVKQYEKFKNILFISSIPKKQVQSMLELFDICYIGWQKKEIYNYGVSANKLFDYMYSKKPILHSYSGKTNIVELANCGFSVEAENPKAIADAILKLKAMSPAQRVEMGSNGKNYVLANHDYSKLAERLAKIIFN